MDEEVDLLIKGSSNPSYRAKGRVGDSHPDLLLNTESAEAEQPVNGSWVNSSDHTLIV